jgi:asparagine synthase (glutamine-hydrolysing)
MCGIAGIVDLRGGVEAATIVRMRDTLRHRGPDDAGLWVSPDGIVGLGHRRLSILDLSERGRQPMSDPTGRIRLVFNGEIYNFRPLRDELKGDGAAFFTDTDTEVIIQAYLRWGIDCLGRLEGMFAFALHDSADGVLWLVRDRLGIKPLVYSQTERRLVFGSEIRAVLAAGSVPRDLSPEAAWDFFSYGYVPTPATIYKAVAKLPPGHLLRFSAGQADIRRWWQPRFECIDADPQVAAARLRELVDQSVEDYLVADVPTGSYLSGGLDSTIVTRQAALAFQNPKAAGRRLGGSNLCTFSIGFDVAKHTELHFAAASARQFGTVHTELVVTREMAHEFNETIADLFDEPFAASGTIPRMHLARLARQQVTVALCGEGGDEAFGGYSWYRSWLKFQRPSFWRTARGQAACRVLEAVLRGPKPKWSLPALGPVELYAQLMGAMSAKDKASVFSPDLARAMAGRDGAEYFRRHWRDDLPPMARMQYVDLMTFLPDMCLASADRTSMHFALELRVPLLNHRVVEYAVGLPQEVRNPGGELKGLFRRTMWDRLPEPIRHRKKAGFSAPVKQWFSTGELLRLIAAVRNERPDLSSQWLHPRLEAFAQRVEGTRAYKLWMMLQWLRRHS